jgi:hypothetical protein
MAIMLGKLYEALQQATGVDVTTAREAAEEVAGYESRLAAIDGQLKVLTWMVGTNVALTIGVFFLVLRGRL